MLACHRSPCQHAASRTQRPQLDSPTSRSQSTWFTVPMDSAQPLSLVPDARAAERGQGRVAAASPRESRTVVSRRARALLIAVSHRHHASALYIVRAACLGPGLGRETVCQNFYIGKIVKY
eukprot:6172828-Pleurochrysis_carterae.AAC.1